MQPVMAWINCEAAFVRVIHATNNAAPKERCTNAAKELRRLIDMHLPW